jgi:hypothetical protein
MDNAKHLQYCDWFSTLLQEKGRDVLDDTFYINEAWFHLSGYVNSQNSCLWSTENLCALHQTPFAQPEDWCVNYYFVEMNLRPEFLPSINCTCCCDDNAQLDKHENDTACFKQDGAPVHRANKWMKFLERVGIWPPRLPYLTAPDSFSWGVARQKYENNSHTWDKHEMAVIQFTQWVTQEDLVKVYRNTIKHVNAC